MEGILMIAVRRPYDIGDRITICSAETVANPTWGDTWLVEDISLTTTTMRYSATNEVATINNASVANSRIVNCARSPKASITFRMRFTITATQKQVDEFRMRLESYLEDRPRIWVGLIHYRMEQTDSDNGFVVWMFRVQHSKSWQELGPIMIHKGEVEKYADEIATEIGINFETPPRQMTVGIGLAKDRKADQATEENAKVAEFIRSLSNGPGGSGGGVGGNIGAHVESRNPDDQVYGVISEYFDAAVPSSTAMAGAPADGSGDGRGDGGFGGGNVGY